VAAPPGRDGVERPAGGTAEVGLRAPVRGHGRNAGAGAGTEGDPASRAQGARQLVVEHVTAVVPHLTARLAVRPAAHQQDDAVQVDASSRIHSPLPVSKSTVQQLAGQIQRGEWQLTHQGIAFDEDGVLIDGQHRLAAIVKAGLTVRLTVAHGVRRTASTVMDTGRKRTGRDALALAGETPCRTAWG
jgi:hypothetical protein